MHTTMERDRRDRLETVAELVAWAIEKPDARPAVRQTWLQVARDYLDAVIDELAAGPQETSRRPAETRTRAEVIAARCTVAGCCSRHADNMGCDCLERATGCIQCGDSGYLVHPENGFRRGIRCSRGCPARCSICRDPNCDNPDGQH